MYRVTFLGLVCFCVLSAADGSDYKASSLAVAWSQSAVLKGADYTVEPKLAKYSVEAVYTGEHREMTAERRTLIRGWASAVGQPKFAEMFDFEIAVRSENKVFWLPIQNALAEPFANEVENGARLKLYIVYIGAVKDDRIFLLNEFEVLHMDLAAIPVAPMSRLAS
jgi:hypothetical protein